MRATPQRATMTMRRFDPGMVSMMTMTQERFISLWKKYIRDDVTAAPGPIYEDLFRRYSEPHRRYHTPRHIDRCLEQLDLARNLMDDPDAVEMALWFHDVIYDPGENDNELKSAEWFTSIARHSLELASLVSRTAVTQIATNLGLAFIRSRFSGVTHCCNPDSHKPRTSIH